MSLGYIVAQDLANSLIRSYEPEDLMNTQRIILGLQNHIPEKTEYERWAEDYQRRLDEEKRNDPKTLFGWALKTFK